MARLEITIDLDNDAFDYLSEEGNVEVARILDVIGVRFYEAKASGKWLNVHDINGNPVGKFRVDPEAIPSFS